MVARFSDGFKPAVSLCFFNLLFENAIVRAVSYHLSWWMFPLDDFVDGEKAVSQRLVILDMTAKLLLWLSVSPTLKRDTC